MRQAVRMFATERASERWFVEWRWPDGVRCVSCGGGEVMHRAGARKPFRCVTRIGGGRKCEKLFSVKTGTFMHASKLPLMTWGLAIYIMTTHLKSVSSMKLHRDLGITQKTAWHLAHRIRNSGAYGSDEFAGKFNMDGVRLGGRESGSTMLKRAHTGTFHQLSDKHARRYVGEFAGRQGSRSLDTVALMGNIVLLGGGRRLTYRQLTEQGRSKRSPRAAPL